MFFDGISSQLHCKLLILMGLSAILPLGATACAADVAVSEQDMAFVPDHLTIQHGDRIVFHNDSGISHQVIVLKGSPEMALAKQHEGETAMLTLPTPGTVEIGCDFHPMMALSVTVE